MNVYDTFRDSVAWRPSLGDPIYPGVENLGPEQTIPARVLQTTQDVAGDQVSTETIWTYPEHAIVGGSRLNGGLVIAVDAAKDRAGGVLYWISRVTR